MRAVCGMEHTKSQSRYRLTLRTLQEGTRKEFAALSNEDPSFGHVEPFSFGLGQHNVIKGWDDALAIMKKGMKATFYIPSPLAYGANGPSPKIGPNAILIFDIELLSFK